MHILIILIFFEAKTVILPLFISLAIGYFGFWPLGRVGFEVTFNLFRPEFFTKLAEFFFYKFGENWSILGSTGRMSNRDP